MKSLLYTNPVPRPPLGALVMTNPRPCWHFPHFRSSISSLRNFSLGRYKYLSEPAGRFSDSSPAGIVFPGSSKRKKLSCDVLQSSSCGFYGDMAIKTFKNSIELLWCCRHLLQSKKLAEMKPEKENKLRLILRLKAQSTVHPAIGCCGSSHGIYHAYNSRVGDSHLAMCQSQWISALGSRTTSWAQEGRQRTEKQKAKIKKLQVSHHKADFIPDWLAMKWGL